MKAFFYFKIKLLLVVCLIGISNNFYAQSTALLLDDNFDYAEGSDLVGQNGWVLGTAGTNKVTISTMGLSYPGYPDSDTGLAAAFNPLSDRVQKSFTGTLNNSYFYAFLIRVNSVGTGDFFAGFFSGNAFRGRVYLKADGNGFQFGLVKTTTGTVTYTTGAPFSFGTTYLVVVKYDFIAGSGNDEVSLFINPDLNANNPGSPVIGPLTDTGNDVSANVFAIQGRTNAGSFSLDGLRIATTWNAIKGTDFENHYLELPRFISSDMVIQRDTPLKLRGWAVAGDTVLVEFIRQNRVVKDSVEVNADGRWEVQLPAQAVSVEPCRLKFSLKGYPETFQQLENILIGDVWLAGGQSNMEKKVNHLLEAEDYIREADDFPNIRAFRASYNALAEPSEKVNAGSAPWIVCNSLKVADNVSAVAYVFAREIYEKTGIPVGIMQAYRGGTELETWLSPWKLAEPEYCKIAGRNDFLDAGNSANAHSVNFNGQVNPLKGFPLKGFIWYQGESNTKRPNEYRYMMKMLIEDWRTLWNQGDLPFYYVQMFNVSAPAVYEEATWADLREQQNFLLYDKTVPNTGMAVIIDTNEEALNPDDDIRMHPRNKKVVGIRLANIALKDTYGFELLAEGPVLNRYRISNDSVYLYFKNTGEGLKIKTGDAELQGFVVSGTDKKFKPTEATILNDSTVALRSTQVSQPVAVRYGWARNPVCNLYNAVDIPATPFRTDGWKLSSYTEPQSSCPVQTGNSKLVAVIINGMPLQDFNPEQFTYNIASGITADKADVLAIADSPFAEVSVSGPEQENTILITVTSEDASRSVYELTFDRNTGFYENTKGKWTIMRSEEGMIVKNNSGEALSLKMFNPAGQCLSVDRLEGNGEKKYNLSKGVVFLDITDSSGRPQTIKYLIK